MDNIEYLSFNGKEFTEFINFVKLMNNRDKSKYARVVILSIKENNIICYAIDDTSNIIEYAIEKYNIANEIKDNIAIPITDLVALVKSAFDDKFIIRKIHNQFEFKVIGGGWIPFKTTDADFTNIIINGNETDIGVVNSVKLRNAIIYALGYTQEYTYARDKYIQFTKSQMTVTSRLSGVVTSDEFVEMTLHRDDAAMLKSLLKDNFNLIVKHIDGPISRMLFIGPKFKFSTIEAGIESSNITYLNDLTDYISIECDELYKLAIFSEEYSVSKHIIGLSIKNSKLNVSIKNVLAAKHCSTVQSNIIGDVKDTKNEAEVSSHALLKALKVFQDKKDRLINIYITDKMLNEQNSILIFDENTQAIINIYNR